MLIIYIENKEINHIMMFANHGEDLRELFDESIVRIKDNGYEVTNHTLAVDEGIGNMLINEFSYKVDFAIIDEFTEVYHNDPTF